MDIKRIRKEAKYFLIRTFLARPIYNFLKLYSHTLRFKLENMEPCLEYLRFGGRIVIASWHQRFFGGFYMPDLLGLPVSIMISRSRDGDFIADAVSRIGWIPVRGSGTLGGRKALQEMIAAVRASGAAGHIVDGPNGPPFIIKPGLVTLAQQSGASVFPAYVSYERPIVFNSWDRYMIPKPFSRVIFRLGPPERVPEDLDSDAFERTRLQIEEKMRREYQEIDRYWKTDVDRKAFRFLYDIRKSR